MWTESSWSTFAQVRRISGADIALWDIFGTMVGAGGGFILTPILLLLFPGRPSEIITATSLSVE